MPYDKAYPMVLEVVVKETMRNIWQVPIGSYSIHAGVLNQDHALAAQNYTSCQKQLPARYQVWVQTKGTPSQKSCV